MCKWTVCLLLLCSKAFANTKQETYYNSCYSSFYVAMTNISTDSQDKVRNMAKDYCQAFRDRWDKENTWDTIKFPMFQGCYNAMEAIGDPKLNSEQKKRKSLELAAKFCVGSAQR